MLIEKVVLGADRNPTLTPLFMQLYHIFLSKIG